MLNQAMQQKSATPSSATTLLFEAGATEA